MAKVKIWKDILKIESRSYVCGYCGHPLASENGWIGYDTQSRIVGWIYVCHSCTRPTYFDSTGGQTPGIAFGNPVAEIPIKDVADLYEEARRATSANAYTAAVLACRKLLMHIAVSKGAEKDKGFTYYAKYLADKHYVPPDAVGWVDHIKDKGNDANHEIVIMDKADARDLLMFSEMLLKVIYEYPASVRKKEEPDLAEPQSAEK